jgi:hypothetical protein
LAFSFYFPFFNIEVCRYSHKHPPSAKNHLKKNPANPQKGKAGFSVHPKYKSPITGNTAKTINPKTKNDQMSSMKDACINLKVKG